MFKQKIVCNRSMKKKKLLTLNKDVTHTKLPYRIRNFKIKFKLKKVPLFFSGNFIFKYTLAIDKKITSDSMK